jgi:hypothetical protein
VGHAADGFSVLVVSTEKYMLAHMDQASAILSPVPVILLIFVVDLALTALHIFQEWTGRPAPLWQVFGAVVGVRLPNRLGFALFTPVLLVLLWLLGLIGLAGWFPVLGRVPLRWAVCALGAIIGARISDSFVSHWLLYWLGYRPNPGILSTPLYVGEAVFLLAAFWPGLKLAQATAWVGFVLGTAFFVAILPILRAGRLIKTWRRDAWVRGKPIPAWATLT